MTVKPCFTRLTGDYLAPAAPRLGQSRDACLLLTQALRFVPDSILCDLRRRGDELDPPPEKVGLAGKSAPESAKVLTRTEV